MNNFVMQTTSHQKHEVDIQNSPFFNAWNISLAIVENKHFVNLISSLQQGFKQHSQKNF